MKVVYVDTSVLVSLSFEGENARNRRFVQILNASDEVVSSSLLEAEFLAVAKREKLEFAQANKMIQHVSLILPDRSLVSELKRVFNAGYVRGADALHLACALYLDGSAKDIHFLTADLQQLGVAKQLGFKVSEL